MSNDKNQEIALLSAFGLGVRYEKEWIIKDFDFSIVPGEIVTFVGPNGGGKTTTIKALLGIIKASTGHITKKDGMKIGYVPQIKAISPYLPLSVSDFLRLFHKSPIADISRFLTMVGISGLENKQVHTLSGGQFQRMFLAQALLNNPDLLVLDEPTQGIDFRGEVEFYQLIEDLSARFHCAVILVSHNLHLVMAKSNKVICINRHICCQGVPEVIVDNQDFRKIFGEENVSSIAMYAHQHRHKHDYHGQIFEK